MYIICTSDDIQPCTLPLFYKYWKPLKIKHPGLKVTFFVAPFNQEFSQPDTNFIGDNEEWQKWWEENQDWVEIQPHGFSHKKPFEGEKSFEEQLKLIKNSLTVLESYLKEKFIYKAPFYRMNTDTIKALIELGCIAFSQWWNLSLLVPSKRKLSQYIELPTHTNVENGKNPDNIDKVYDQLDENLTKLESAGWEYRTMGELVEEAIQ